MSDIPDLFKFDPTSASRPALCHELRRLAGRLTGLSRRMEDMEIFREKLKEDKAHYLTIAVDTELERDGVQRLTRFFDVPLTPEMVETVKLMCQVTEEALNDEIATAKGFMNTVLDEF